MNIFERESASLFHTYKRLPLEIEYGEGVYLYTRDGRKYLDMFGGLAVNALGYGHPRILAAIGEQSRKYIHLSNYFAQEPQVHLAEMLRTYSGYKKVFFSNSGAESIEGAIKLARKWGTRSGKTRIISFSNAFHGRTMGALSLMDRPKYLEGYGPFLPGCTTVEFNNISELRKTVSSDTLAIALECIQGEGGVVPVTEEFVGEINNLQKKFGCLVIADEIQSGIGRTGKLFGFQHFTLTPDIVVIAKPIGGGLPLGAILGNQSVADVFDTGVHGTTFGGNPVACAAGMAVLDEIVEHGVIDNARAMGTLLLSGLRQLHAEFPSLVKEVRGYGLMAGMELTREGENIVTTLRDDGILINCTNSNVLRFLPPLIIQQVHVETTINSLRNVFRKL
jgi:acetylornithine/N-succinyldiaminopimelate aminotransferase